MRNYTDEPWEVGDGFFADGGGECIHTESGLWIAEFFHEGSFEDDDQPSVPVDYKAHARLAAAAPELLAALKNAVSHIASDGDNAAGFSKAEVLAIFRAAIAKAEES